MNADMRHSQRGLALSALRDVRERRGMSQEELAEKAGMTRAAIANLERGVSRARPSSAYHLAEALQVYVDTLTGALPLPGDEPKEPHGILSEYFEAAMRHAIYRRAGEQQRVYGAIPGIEALWARGFTREEAERELRETLEWWVLTAVFEHQPLPAFDGVSLEIVEESKSGTAVVYPMAAPSAASFLDGVDAEPESGGESGSNVLIPSADALRSG
jgi:transcriptional regulator with XRE-family HTH domain